MCFSWSGRTRYVTELAVLLGLTDTRSVMMTRTPGTKATGVNARDALEQLDTFQAATFRSAVGLIGYIVLDRPECQYAAKTVRSATREATNLDWMRMMRLAKFLVSHSELEWIYQAQDVPEKYVVFGDSDWAGSESRRSTTGAFEQNGLHPIEFSCSLHSTSLLSRAGRQSCMLQDVRQREDCSQSSCWLRLEWSRSWKYSRTVPQTSACTTELDRGECGTWT